MIKYFYSSVLLLWKINFPCNKTACLASNTHSVRLPIETSSMYLYWHPENRSDCCQPLWLCFLLKTHVMEYLCINETIWSYFFVINVSAIGKCSFTAFHQYVLFSFDLKKLKRSCLIWLKTEFNEKIDWNSNVTKKL